MTMASALSQQMIDFQKQIILSCYDAATVFQNQATATMDQMLTQAAWVPRESRQAITAWMDICQQECDRLKVYVEKSYTNLGMFFTDQPAAAPAKTKKPAAPKEKTAVTATPIKAAPVEAKKETPVAEKKAAPIEVKKAPPVETKKAAPAKPQATKTAAVKNTGAAKKQGKKVLK